MTEFYSYSDIQAYLAGVMLRDPWIEELEKCVAKAISACPHSFDPATDLILGDLDPDEGPSPAVIHSRHAWAWWLRPIAGRIERIDLRAPEAVINNLAYDPARN